MFHLVVRNGILLFKELFTYPMFAEDLHLDERFCLKFSFSINFCVRVNLVLGSVSFLGYKGRGDNIVARQNKETSVRLNIANFQHQSVFVGHGHDG